MIKRGALHAFLLMLVVASVYLVSSRGLRLSSNYVEGLASIAYLFGAGSLGYLYKKQYGKTGSFFENAAIKALAKYSFGAALVIVTLSTLVMLPQIVAFGSWWPLSLFILIPIGLSAQTVHFAFLVMAGGWFCKQ